MRILRRGKTVETWYIGHCRKCDCLFAIDGNDPKDAERIVHDFSNNRMSNCPNCRKKIMLLGASLDTVIYYSNFPERWEDEHERNK